ncbi:MAG TPA: zinc metallopeptidase [Candidatus Flavonifractor merdipullorum]|uniref:Zinc metallopeptidase n=1 Tax=Candidatus Flavonifractor merdipullorum TaxID=2838590 RepID=A0A9D1UNB9_9FIRM|nr:zinc metallopeptidase [Candidatus Flavonifractor merdipullorum]
MPYFFYGFDPYYWMLLVPAMLIAAAAQWKVSSSFRRWSRVPVRRGMTGAQAAQEVLRAHGVMDVRIERVRGHLTDHYDPRTNTIRLSDSVYDAATVAAVGVAAHEAGHAVQYAVGYGPIRLRSAIIPVCNVGSQLSLIFILLGLFLYVEPLFAVGIVLFSLAVVAQIVTLPVEFNASRRAMETLGSTGLLAGEELTGARKVLSAAAMTYVAALLVSLAQLARFLLAFAGRRRD